MVFPAESQGAMGQSVEGIATPLNPNVDEYVKFVFGSYAVSQASKSLQGLVYDHYRLLHPDWEITEELDAFVYDRILGRAKQITSGRGHVFQPSIVVERDLREQLTVRRERFYNPEYAEENADGLYMEIARELILIDFNYLCLIGRRPNKPKENVPYNPYLDPLLSYVSYFALEKKEGGEPAHTTKFEEADALYKKVGELVERGEDLGTVSLMEIGYRQPEYHPQLLRGQLVGLGITVDGHLVQIRDLLEAAKNVHDNRPL